MVLPDGSKIRAYVQMLGAAPIIRTWIETPVGGVSYQLSEITTESINLVYAVFRSQAPHKIVIYSVRLYVVSGLVESGKSPFTLTFGDDFPTEYGFKIDGQLSEYGTVERDTGIDFKLCKHPKTEEEYSLSWYKNKIYMLGDVITTAPDYEEEKQVVVCACLDFSTKAQAPVADTELSWFYAPGNMFASGKRRVFFVDISSDCSKILYFQYPTSVAGEYAVLGGEPFTTAVGKTPFLNGKTFVGAITKNEMTVVQTNSAPNSPEIVEESSSSESTDYPEGVVNWLPSSGSKYSESNGKYQYDYLVAFNARFNENTPVTDTMVYSVLAERFERTDDEVEYFLSGVDGVGNCSGNSQEQLSWPVAPYKIEKTSNSFLWKLDIKVEVWGHNIPIYYVEVSEGVEGAKKTITTLSGTAQIYICEDEQILFYPQFSTWNPAYSSEGEDIHTNKVDMRYIKASLGRSPAFFQIAKWDGDYEGENDHAAAVAARNWHRETVVFTPDGSFEIPDVLPLDIGPAEDGEIRNPWVDFFADETYNEFFWYSYAYPGPPSEVARLDTRWRLLIHKGIKALFSIHASDLLSYAMYKRRVTPPPYYIKIKGAVFCLVPVKHHFCLAAIETASGWVTHEMSNVGWDHSWFTAIAHSPVDGPVDTRYDYRLGPIVETTKHYGKKT
jgi:hypothetical protein